MSKSELDVGRAHINMTAHLDHFGTGALAVLVCVIAFGIGVVLTV
jgi:hypothetical protein